MKKHVLVIILFILILPVTAFTQSRYLEEGIGGPGFEFGLGIDDYKLTSFSVATGYSIGGIMDIGVLGERASGTLYTADRTDINFGFVYNLIIVKQKQDLPFSIQLEGSYGYTNVSSDYLDFFHYQKEGQGFKVGASIYSEMAVSDSFSILFGGKSLYENYLFTQTDISDPAAPVVNSTERVEELKLGFLFYISMKLDRWPVISIGSDVLYPVNEQGILLKPSVSFTLPTY